MPSPSGIFKGLSADELAELKASALSRIISGDRTSIGGGGRNGSKSWSMSPDQIMIEVRYALGTMPPSRVQSVLTCQGYGCKGFGVSFNQPPPGQTWQIVNAPTGSDPFHDFSMFGGVAPAGGYYQAPSADKLKMWYFVGGGTQWIYTDINFA